MGLLRLAVLGPPEIFHEDSRLTFPLRKTQALLLYLAIERGMHPRSKLAAFLWPDSGPSEGRIALRNALVPLRKLLVSPDASASPHSHLLLDQRDLLGLNLQAPFELDLDVVQQAYQQVRQLSTAASLQEHATLVTQVQHALALVRGPFLDGFWLGEDAPFDVWREQQQQQWQVRLLLLVDRLSSWQGAAGEWESARATLTRWVALDPLAEEAYRRLMRVALAQGDAAAAVQVYTTLQGRLAQALQIAPSPETVALAEHSRTLAARPKNIAVRPPIVESGPPFELVAPLLGRTVAFRHLVGSFQQTQAGQPQAVLVMGEAGIGKTRLANEFVAWSRAQGAEVLRGQVFEMGGRLSYQPLIGALRERLEAENAPEDLLEDVWLSELSRLLPELRVRYPDLSAPTEDELTAKGRLFEAVAQLLNALAQRAPLVLFVDDLQWVDVASLDLLRYLGSFCKEHSCRVLWLCTVRGEELELNPQLSTLLDNLGRDLPVTQVSLQTLNQAETLQLIEALVVEGEHNMVRPSINGPEEASSPERETTLPVLSDFLFTQTGGQPLFLLEMLKLLRDRELLVPRWGADGTWRLEPTVDMAAVVAQERSRHEWLPLSVRALVRARLSKLTGPAREVVMVSTVLGRQATAQLLWQMAGLEVQAGIEALEEVVKSGILREEVAGKGRPGSYSFAHDLIRDVVYTELGALRRQVLHQRALAVLESEGARAAELAHHAMLAGKAEAAYRFSVQAGVEAVAVFAVADAIGYYEQARTLLQGPERIQPNLAVSEVERLYVHLGQAYACQNAWKKAQQAYEELLAYVQHQRQFTLASKTLNRLAILAAQQPDDKPQVLALLEDARHMAETSSDQQALAETAWNRAQIIGVMWDDPKSALSHGEQALSLARSIQDQELEARSLSSLGYIHIRAGDFEVAVHCLEAALALFALLGNESSVSGELSLPNIGASYSLTQPLTYRATEAVCWALLALAQVHAGQVQPSIYSGRRALALSRESKNVWAQVTSTICLTHGLLDTGADEEALGLMQHATALARTFPPTIVFYSCLSTMGNVYLVLQQWEEARRTLEEADALAERFGLGSYRIPALSRLCMHCTVTGQWTAAYQYAVRASAIRKSYNTALIMQDLSRQYETEALLHAGDEQQAREEVPQLGERLGTNRRFRIPYLRSLAVLDTWEGERERAIGHLREAVQLAAEIGLPTEQWQIQAALGRTYEARGKFAQAHTAFEEAATIIQRLAEGIKDDALRSRFLAGPQIHPVLQQAQRLATLTPDNPMSPSGQ